MKFVANVVTDGIFVVIVGWPTSGVHDHLFDVDARKRPSFPSERTFSERRPRRIGHSTRGQNVVVKITTKSFQSWTMQKLL